MKRISLLLTLLVFVISCSKEEPTPPPPTKYNVSISLNPTEGGTVSPSGGQFNEGQTVSFTVTPSEYYIFKNWSGSDTSSNNPLSITINSNKTLTVNFEKKDTDGDGVTDDIDQCPDTPEGEEVNGTGCSSSQVDTDGDGVSDDIDLDNSTREGVPVDENGVMLNPIYLDENGITIKSQEWGIVGDIGVINDVEYTIVDNELFDNLNVTNTDFTRIVTTLVTDMSYKFSNVEDFNQDISQWDVSNVVNMEGMFSESNFNQEIGNWNVSQVVNMGGMFMNLQVDRTFPFNQDLSSWDVSNVTYMGDMFRGTEFNQDIGNWNVSNVTSMTQMFTNTPFNQYIGDWDVSGVTDMSGMFGKSKFNQDISDWDVSSVEKMWSMFYESPFNQDIGEWDVSGVLYMDYMFSRSDFNQNISDWDVSNVVNMERMFFSTQFNQDLSNWNVDNVSNCNLFLENTPQWTLPKPNFINCNPGFSDTDRDGVTDDIDQCPNTPSGEEVDENGCSVNLYKLYGGGDSDYGYNIIETYDNNYLIIGSTRSYGNGGDDVYLIKIDQDGVVQWEQTYGGSDDDYGFDIIETYDNNYLIIGSTRSYGNGGDDVYLIKIDQDGVVQWEQTYGGSDDDYGFDIIETLEDKYLLVGMTYSFGSGSSDGYIIQINSQGIVEREKTLGSQNYDEITSVKELLDGQLLLLMNSETYTTTGNSGEYSTLFKLDSNLNVLNENRLDGKDFTYLIDFIINDNSDIYVFGSGSNYNQQDSDFYLVKLDQNLNLIFERTYGGGGNETGYGITKSIQGGFVMIGSTYSNGSSDDILVVKINESGSKQWDVLLGGNNEDEGYRVLSTQSGYLILGHTFSYSDTGYIYLTKLDFQGNISW